MCGEDLPIRCAGEFVPVVPFFQSNEFITFVVGSCIAIMIVLIYWGCQCTIREKAHIEALKNQIKKLEQKNESK